MQDDLTTQLPNQIIKEPLSDALSKRYLAYALSTITARALPDVRDGLKPVQRRILYAMRELKLNPEANFRKCAKIVGEVMGNYHPHGDQAIYDTLVRLAQHFSVRYPLVDGQGNFGNIDGDGAAAMRYTESRMTAAAGLLLDGLDENAVDFRVSYDEQDEEPCVLPAGFPNLLANGTTGIAVGMATSIPPHNVAELIGAALLLIKSRNTELEALLEHVRGPDFPTGGVIVEAPENIRVAYTTGRGGFRLRAKWHVEKLERGMWQIIVTEMPYQVQKSRLIERLAELIESKKAALLGDVRDESAEDIRLVLEPRAKTVDPSILMESLFKLSELETRISLNLNVLVEGIPKVLGLKDTLLAFIDHRRNVVIRRAQFRLDKILNRLEVLAGYLIAYLNLDEVIRIIREEDDAKASLMAAFDLSETQADAILNMRLRALRKLEEIEIRKEYEALLEEKTQIEVLLETPSKQWRKVSDELKAIAKTYGPDTELGARRSSFDAAPEIGHDALLEASIPKEAITVVLSRMGWIRALKGHNNDLTRLKFKDGDELGLTAKIWTNDKLLLFASDGRAFTLAGDKLPGGRGQGEPIRLSIELGEDQDILAIFAPEKDGVRLVASSNGYGFFVPDEALLSSRKAGKQVVNLSNGARLALCKQAAGDHLAVIGENRKLLIFPAAELPNMPRGKGVKLQNYRDGGLADALGFNAADDFAWQDSGGRNRALPEWREWLGRRAGAGRMAPRGFPRSGRFEP